MFQFVIGTKKTKDDWGLLLSSYDMGVPEPKTKYVNIPYGDGSIDLTEALTGDVAYGDRKAEATFTIVAPRDQWMTIMNNIKSYCHGKKFHIVSPEDTTHYYIGRVTVGVIKREASSAEFEVEMICNPYRYKNDVTTVIVNVAGTQEVILSNEQKRALPTFVTDAEVQIVFGSNSFNINAGTHTLPIVLEQGDNALQFNGTANVTITYQEGAL